ncbi:hypothetical protein L484_014614 [Morus notabilis]|uniref:Uncharacterized protein n=1 Tax=Morus notabilis TaxID=981085 RepID=W9R922_9ROSA|nr:hypothetical protein L484_014614 [Morus notabilis]
MSQVGVATATVISVISLCSPLSPTEVLTVVRVLRHGIRDLQSLHKSACSLVFGGDIARVTAGVAMAGCIRLAIVQNRAVDQRKFE